MGFLMWAGDISSLDLRTSGGTCLSHRSKMLSFCDFAALGDDILSVDLSTWNPELYAACMQPPWAENHITGSVPSADFLHPSQSEGLCLGQHLDSHCIPWPVAESLLSPCILEGVLLFARQLQTCSSLAKSANFSAVW